MNVSDKKQTAMADAIQKATFRWQWAEHINRMDDEERHTHVICLVGRKAIVQDYVDNFEIEEHKSLYINSASAKITLQKKPHLRNIEQFESRT